MTGCGGTQAPTTPAPAPVVRDPVATVAPPDPFPAAIRSALAARRARRDAATVWPPEVAPLKRRFTDGVPGASYALESVTGLCEQLPDHALDPGALGCDEFAAALAKAPSVARDAEVEIFAREVVLRFAWVQRGRAAAAVWQEGHVWRRWMRRRRWQLSSPANGVTSALGAEQFVLTTVADHLNGGRIRQAIQWPQPRGGQYSALVDLYRRYKGVGAFIGLPKSVQKLRQRHRGAAVLTLRARLSQEGFTSAPKKPEVFDHTLVDALAAFQRAHGLGPATRVGPKTLRAFNIPLSDKLDRIAGALQAWREAPRRSGTFVQVNIPAFEGELRVEGESRLRFPTIVGKARREWVHGKRVRPNATPTLASHIVSIVFNPRWNIPKRILEEDILPKEEEFYGNFGREAWLEENGYEIIGAGTRNQRVRQPAGPTNPLGRVKFVMPNAHAIYLHDTAGRWHFRRQRRDLSHGCIRVKRPLKLAEAIVGLAGRQGSWRQARRWLRRGDTASIVLEEPVPVFLDYVLVWVDGHGRPRFLKDIYGKNK